jgi:hypothetical protein
MASGIKRNADYRRQSAITDTNEELDSENEKLVQKAKAAKTEDSTKNNYKSHLRSIHIFLKEHYSEFAGADECIKLPLSDNAIIGLLEYFTEKRTFDKKTKEIKSSHRSYTDIMNFKSALIALYNDNHMRFKIYKKGRRFFHRVCNYAAKKRSSVTSKW